jgi:Zn-dependent protease with chaperone function
MKWLLVFFAIWNVACALLRAFRMPLEKLRFMRRLYPNRDLLALEQVGDRELSSGAKARYRAAAEQVRRLAGMRMPELLCSPKRGMLAGTRGWIRHQLQLSRGTLNHASEEDLLAILAHEFGHIYYRHFAVLRIAELAASATYAFVVGRLWHTSFTWYAYLGIWSLLDFSFSMFRLAIGSATELMADHFAAHKLGLASELSRGLMRAQCFNGATEFRQIISFYPTVKLRLRLLSRYDRAAG